MFSTSILVTLYNILCAFIFEFFNYFDRYRVINDRQNKEPYLERYYLFLKDRENFPFNIFLHKFLKSDSDDLHDHPWSYFSFIIKGGYWEYTSAGKFWRGPWSCIYRKADSKHRIELEPSVGDCWSLFIPGIKKREWGFHTENGWVEHSEYLQSNKEK
tara:strand:+ start:125 stop:598 length:474 start_codon:yes stop_codon:yes gene_type:complete